MAINITVRPITHWPGKENPNPKPSQFRTGYKQTLVDLQNELHAASALEGSLILEMHVDERMIRQDGKLRADARVNKPGVIFRFSRFTGKRRPDNSRETQDVSYPCDAFDSWQDNLRAIMKSMEHLRHVERYGVFKYDDIISRLALPSAEGKVSTKETAAAFLATHSGVNREEILMSDTARATAYRRAARKLHPDAREGNLEDFQKLAEANKVLTTGY